MGLQHSKKAEGQEKIIEQQGLQKRDPRYGGNILFYKYSQTVLQTLYLDQQSKQSFTKLLDSRRRLSHKNFITLKQSKIKELKQFCSMSPLYEVQIQYEYQSRTLQDQISKYCGQRRPFQQSSLRSIFISVVEVLQHLKENKTCHGDVKPSTIMVDGARTTKIIDSYFISGGKISYQIVMENPSSMSLLSPEQLDTLRSRKFATIQHIHQTQMWQVGLSMLEAMTAEPAMQAYDLSTLTIKKHHFDNKLEELLSYNYSRTISELVLSCLSIQKEQRPTFQQFLSTLKKQERQSFLRAINQREKNHNGILQQKHENNRNQSTLNGVMKARGLNQDKAFNKSHFVNYVSAVGFSSYNGGTVNKKSLPISQKQALVPMTQFSNRAHTNLFT